MDHKAMKSILCIPQARRAWETCHMDTWRDRAKARMRELGISQERLAEQFSMTPAGMQKWLAGARQPAFEEINQIADHLGVTRTWLTYGTDPNDTTDGLTGPAKTVVRKLILLERTGRLPESLWDAIGSMVNAVAPLPEETAKIKSPATAKNGTTN
ncbi:helix-turn-helix domain-containing protein [Delftia acidovorans]|uniref:helix-turn-helix domain-containing protein n=2 Tax=Delftia acidovorans TaxID=80866 RepID=UPI00241FDB1D|nr:helix-turn-helix transcriptional regulator [Delftia acidovorans]